MCMLKAPKGYLHNMTIERKDVHFFFFFAKISSLKFIEDVLDSEKAKNLEGNLSSLDGWMLPSLNTTKSYKSNGMSPFGPFGKDFCKTTFVITPDNYRRLSALGRLHMLPQIASGLSTTPT